MAGGLQHKIFLGYPWWFIEVDEERTQHFKVSPGFWFHVGCLPFLKFGNGVGKEFIRKLLRCVETSQKRTIVWDKACGEHGNTPDALKEHNKYLSPKGVMQLIEKSHRTKSFLRDLGNICTREDLSTVFQTWIASDFTGLPIARPVVPVALRPVPLLPPSPVVVPLQPPPPVALLPVPPLPTTSRGTTNAASTSCGTAAVVATTSCGTRTAPTTSCAPTTSTSATISSPNVWSEKHTISQGD